MFGESQGDNGFLAQGTVKLLKSGRVQVKCPVQIREVEGRPFREPSWEPGKCHVTSLNRPKPGKAGDPLDDLLCLYATGGEQVQKGTENKGLLFTFPDQAARPGTVPRIPLQRLKLVLILITELSQWKPTSLT